MTMRNSCIKLLTQLRNLNPEGLDLLLQLRLSLTLHVILGLGQMRNLEERKEKILKRVA